MVLTCYPSSSSWLSLFVVVIVLCCHHSSLSSLVIVVVVVGHCRHRHCRRCRCRYCHHRHWLCSWSDGVMLLLCTSRPALMSSLLQLSNKALIIGYRVCGTHLSPTSPTIAARYRELIQKIQKKADIARLKWTCNVGHSTHCTGPSGSEYYYESGCIFAPGCGRWFINATGPPAPLQQQRWWQWSKGRMSVLVIFVLGVKRVCWPIQCCICNGCPWGCYICCSTRRRSWWCWLVRCCIPRQGSVSIFIVLVGVVLVWHVHRLTCSHPCTCFLLHSALGWYQILITLCWCWCSVFIAWLVCDSCWCGVFIVWLVCVCAGVGSFVVVFGAKVDQSY